MYTEVTQTSEVKRLTYIHIKYLDGSETQVFHCVIVELTVRKIEFSIIISIFGEYPSFLPAISVWKYQLRKNQLQTIQKWNLENKEYNTPCVDWYYFVSSLIRSLANFIMLNFVLM